MQHEYYMQQAPQLAEQARDKNEVPIGAIVVHNDQ
ncbi:MAG: hypothetical protein JKY60_04935, partial [Kordiimonadaceae bacterium]|nr:hypothetical protein [Kordiimonadaceae bacterium]